METGWTQNVVILEAYTYGALMPIGLGIALGLLIIGTIHRCNLDTQGE